MANKAPDALSARTQHSSSKSNWFLRFSEDSYTTHNNLVQQATTDVNGNYSFTGVPTGSYTIAEENQSGWLETYPASGTYTVTLTGGQTLNNEDFGTLTGKLITSFCSGFCARDS